MNCTAKRTMFKKKTYQNHGAPTQVNARLKRLITQDNRHSRIKAPFALYCWLKFSPWNP